MINFNNVSVKFGSFYALKNASFSVHKGHFMHILGPNGSGKTTLVKLLVNLMEPSEGHIQRNVTSIGYLPQKLIVNRKLPLTVLEVIYSGFKKPKLKPTKQEINLIKYWLAEMDIAHLLNHSMAYLSGGQQQRVYLIRAIIQEPDLLVLDEPTSALDPSFRQKFFNLLLKLHQEKNMTIVNVTHDINDAIKKLDCVLYIDQDIRFWGSYQDYLQFEKGHHHV